MAHLDTAYALGASSAEAAFEKNAVGTLGRMGIGAGVGGAAGGALAAEGHETAGALSGAALGATGGGLSSLLKRVPRHPVVTESQIDAIMKAMNMSGKAAT
jgi:hypothetical protein